MLSLLLLCNVFVEGSICTALANALLSGMDKRFGSFTEDEVCQLAAAFHQKFPLIWLEKYDNSRVGKVTKCMEAKVEDALKRERDDNERDNASFSGSSNNEEEGDDFFSAVTQSKDMSKGHKSLKTKAQNIAKIWLDAKSKDSLIDTAFLNEPILMNLFIRYNTAIPSSASVERLFSTGKGVLRAKRSSLSDENFNMLMFLKDNMHLVQE